MLNLTELEVDQQFNLNLVGEYNPQLYKHLYR